MPGPRHPRRTGLALLTACLALASGCATANAQDTVSLTRANVADPPGRAATIEYGATISSSEGPIPSPITHNDLMLPAGTRLDLRHAGICSQSNLETLGPAGCPPDAKAGHGDGLAVYQVGNETIEEQFTLQIFLADTTPGQVSLLFFLYGHVPFLVEETFTATLGPAPRPYGLDLAVNVPLVPVFPRAPDASTHSTDVTLGQAPSQNSGLQIQLPRRCPHGGWPMATRFAFQDGASSTAARAAPCGTTTTAQHPASRSARRTG